MKIFLEEKDIWFFNGTRVKREIIDAKILPAIRELGLCGQKEIEKRLQIYCPRCQRKIFFIEKDGYGLVYECRSFGCYGKIFISTFPIIL